jgi:large subunit ribosomal protein L29
MKASEIRAKALEQIQSDILDAQEEWMNLRFQRAVGRLADSSLLGKLRRDIARMKTILRERELSAVNSGEPLGQP